jgi:hypothetical protein
MYKFNWSFMENGHSIRECQEIGSRHAIQREYQSTTNLGIQQLRIYKISTSPSV